MQNFASILNFPRGEIHGADLAAAAIRIKRAAQQLTGDTPDDQHDRQLFEDAIDLLQRQAKRVALQAFDDCKLQMAIDRDKVTRQ